MTGLDTFGGKSVDFCHAKASGKGLSSDGCLEPSFKKPIPKDNSAFIQEHAFHFGLFPHAKCHEQESAVVNP
ncbi:hypothetical protein [Acetobacter vaccinii]|uniref:hypothetical protein n=1 Tax=Acetobacter vaccinii TaxID=2592655 RepID=UPI00143CF858|nr:hypothetical protein [Acetobacter vaccinii]